MFLCGSSTKIVQAIRIRQKTLPPGVGVGGLFSLYIYIENFKKLLVRNYWTDFNITWKEYVFGHPLPRLFAIMIRQKNMAARGWGLFSLCIHIENLIKIFLSETTGPISV